MNKRNKIIYIAVFFVCLSALAISYYMFPDEDPVPEGSGDFVREQTSGPSRDAGKNALFGNNTSPAVSPVGQAVLDSVTDAASDPYVSYPDALIELLNIDMDDLLANRDAFKNTIIHVEWMDRVNAILKNLDPVKRAAIIKNQTTLLYIKDKLNEAYLTGKIDHATFIKALADLMKWHQKTYESMLTNDEYLALFEIAPEHVDDTIDGLFDGAPEYSFILNQGIPPHEVTQQVQGYKLEEVNSHFKRMVWDREQIGKKINAGEMNLDQAREALNRSQQAFIAKCKEILTIDEINTIFGSLEALETGATPTEAPAVVGDEDIEQLGFQIENPTTSVDKVREKINNDKIEDIRFFYQEMHTEKEKIISRLDAEEITLETYETISSEIDAAFEENCRSILTDEEYRLIFDVTGVTGSETSPPSARESLQESIEKEIVPQKTTEEKVPEE
ncbi:MAG: hypothetical protein C4548_02005 [Desulfobacteraceae bacterium]|jgi:exonuclease VII small subunit|nr:MAG: hypothetical protein C4548_02005 [Desulfobacteraceae bacterium]